ncbi:MAG: cytochrome P460 family protein [Methylocystis sp.]
MTLRKRVWVIAACATFAIGAFVLSNFSSEPAEAASRKHRGMASSGDAHNPDYPQIDIPPVFDAQGKLVQPKNFRDWYFIGAPITPNGLNNGKANFPEIHNVYVQRSALSAYRATGKWPEGTMMVKELQLVGGTAEFPDGSHFEPSGRGYFPGAVNGLDVAVKDSKRFPNSKNWGYFNFNHSAPPYLPATAEKPVSECAGCHIKNAEEDMVYISHYRPLITPLLGN